MSSHIIVTIMLCVLSCEPAEIRVWDGDSLRLGMTQESEAIRIFNIDAPEIEGQCSYESPRPDLDRPARAVVRVRDAGA